MKMPGQAMDNYCIGESGLSGPGRCRWKDKGTIDKEVDEHDATVGFALVDHHGVSTRDIPVTVCGNCTVIYQWPRRRHNPSRWAERVSRCTLSKICRLDLVQIDTVGSVADDG